MIDGIIEQIKRTYKIGEQLSVVKELMEKYMLELQSNSRIYNFLIEEITTERCTISIQLAANMPSYIISLTNKNKGK